MLTHPTIYCLEGLGSMPTESSHPLFISSSNM